MSGQVRIDKVVCDWILSLSNDFHPALVAQNGGVDKEGYIDENHRKSEVCNLELTDTQRDVLVRSLGELKITSIPKEKRSINLLRYKKGSFFKEHIDGKARYKSLVIQLSDPSDYNGGEFVVDGQIMDKEKGSVFLFDSQTPHEVKELTDGERYSLIIWFKPENFNIKTTMI
jgi:predicted 2-oxoglutarate/Fe(II)-dependent dioxygenase YbiX